MFFLFLTLLVYNRDVFVIFHFDSACQRSKGTKYLAVRGKNINFAPIFVTSVGKFVWPLYVAEMV